MTDARPAAVMILAAGAGTRMMSATPKVLHTVAGRSLVGHALAAATGLDPHRIVVVVRHERDLVAEHVLRIFPRALLADQDAVPGTGRAVYCGLSTLDATAVAAHVAAGAVGDVAVLDTQVSGPIVVISGDVPLVDSTLLADLTRRHLEATAGVTVLTAHVDDPTGYGRIVRTGDADRVASIVEERDADDRQRAIREINAGIYVFDAEALRSALTRLGRDNAQGEMYLTDVIALVREDGGVVQAVTAADPAVVEGVNDRVQLAAVGKALNDRILTHWMRSGVSIVDPATTWIDADVVLDTDVTVLPGTQLHGATSIGEGATIGPDSTLRDVTVGAGAQVLRTHAHDAIVGAGATIGPFAHLRPGTVVHDGAKVGEFVGVKNSVVGKGAKVPHLSYVGDAEIGAGTNIGAGTIVVNYDGVAKHRTTVGEHVRIGSDNTLIAPLTVGDGAYTGAGTTVRHDVPPGALAINASNQRTIEGWVMRRRPGTPSAEAAHQHEVQSLSPGAQEERAAAQNSEGET